MADQKRRRVYKPGLVLRYFYPALGLASMTIGSTVGITALVLFVTDEAESAGIDSPEPRVMIFLICVYLVALGLAAWRQGRIGIWVDDEHLHIRSLIRSRSFCFTDIDAVLVAPRGAVLIGTADCPCVALIDGRIEPARSLALPFARWGGSSSVEICRALNAYLSSK